MRPRWVGQDACQSVVIHSAVGQACGNQICWTPLGVCFFWRIRQASLGRAACEATLFQTPGRLSTAPCLLPSLAAAWC